MARVYRFNDFIGSMGLDHHDGFYYYALFNGMLAPYPGPPVPTPLWHQTMHFVTTPITWFFRKEGGKQNDGDRPVLADNSPIISGDHTLQRVVHVSPGINVLLPVIIYMGEVSWKLCISSVVATKGPVASTIAGVFGMTVNCGDPIAMPTGVSLGPASVHVSPSPGDYAAAVVDYVVSEGINFFTAKGLSGLAGKGPTSKSGAGAQVKAKLGPLLAKQSKRAQGFVVKQGGKVVGKEGAEIFGKIGGDVVKESAKTYPQKQVEKWVGDGTKSELEGHAKGVSGKGLSDVGPTVDGALSRPPQGKK